MIFQVSSTLDINDRNAVKNYQVKVTDPNSTLWSLLEQIEEKETNLNITKRFGIPPIEKNSLFELHITVPGHLYPQLSIDNIIYKKELLQTTKFKQLKQKIIKTSNIEYYYQAPQEARDRADKIYQNFQQKYQAALYQQQNQFQRKLNVYKKLPATVVEQLPPQEEDEKEEEGEEFYQVSKEEVLHYYKNLNAKCEKHSKSFLFRFKLIYRCACIIF